MRTTKKVARKKLINGPKSLSSLQFKHGGARTVNIQKWSAKAECRRRRGREKWQQAKLSYQVSKSWRYWPYSSSYFQDHPWLPTFAKASSHGRSWLDRPEKLLSP
ncbi:uncharacterized protein LOC116245956 isoform X2 [Nymphaea colorata]|uniref:uncharacterized protein LOC116245956 isoform X2 n=1 Tax=Nymphaea colorata TaxID=210225 RepID=UPI00214F2917|nr:uncharacterized protein LOC116245956 isoform X2 [Nymphaea colorata]